MGSLRAGRALNALSQGLGLFAEKSMREEQARIERDWQMALERTREANAQARQEASFAHSEQLARDQNASAERRFATETEATSKYRSDTLAQNESQFTRQEASRARQNLSDNLLELDKAMSKELEAVAYDPAAQEAVKRRYRELKDDAITGHVAWASSSGMPGYDVKDEAGMRSLLVQHGMDVGGAKDLAKQIWSTVDPNALFEEPQPAAAIPSIQGRQQQYQGMVKSGQIIEGKPSVAAAPGISQPATKQPSTEGLFGTPSEDLGPRSPLSLGKDIYGGIHDALYKNRNALEEWRSQQK